MILIYTDKSTSRLQYIAAFIFKEILRVPYSITTHKAGFSEFTGIKLNYSDEEITPNELCIPNHGLLFEKGIQEQTIPISEIENFKVLFSCHDENNKFPFDIFSAIFYLISRYEEYLPYKKDKYERYSHLNSLAYKEGFLNTPLVNVWINYFAGYLKNKFQNVEFNLPDFSFIASYDIDRAYSKKYKRLAQNIFRTIQSLLKYNIRNSQKHVKAILNIQKDPFDNFSWLHEKNQNNKLKPVYFFLVPKKNSYYDKNILPGEHKMITLIKEHAAKYVIGIHPSWQSGDDFSLVQQEKQTLENISGASVTRSRYHYLRFNLPAGYKRLIEAGIIKDYSMGYGAVNGFRASVASSFFWYDIENELQTHLRIYPFCYMDSTAIFHEKLSPDNAYEELKYYYNICNNVNGLFISIVHNDMLSHDNFQWRNVYEKFLNSIAE
jgi:hypothetical protein